MIIMFAVWIAITYEMVSPDNLHNIPILIMCFIAACNFVTSRPKQNVSTFAVDILKYFFLNESLSILIKIWMKYVPNVSNWQYFSIG